MLPNSVECQVSFVLFCVVWVSDSLACIQAYCSHAASTQPYLFDLLFCVTGRYADSPFAHHNALEQRTNELHLRHFLDHWFGQWSRSSELNRGSSNHEVTSFELKPRTRKLLREPRVGGLGILVFGPRFITCGLFAPDWMNAVHSASAASHFELLE